MRIQYCGDTAVLFSNGTCNLNCSYCNIDKNETLLETDKELEDSYNTDYYFNRSCLMNNRTGTSVGFFTGYFNKTANSVTIQSSRYTDKTSWQACGYLAEGEY